MRREDDELSGFLEHSTRGEKRGPKRERPKTIPDGQWRKARDQAREMMTGGRWAEASPRHFAAAYEILHERVYGVLPGELDPASRLSAAGMASAMLERDFGGDVAAMAEYVRWVWAREKENEEWRSRNNREGRRIGWRFMFSASLMTDYRRHQVLARKRT